MIEYVRYDVLQLISIVKSKVRLIELFGSFARGKKNPSDIDIAIFTQSGWEHEFAQLVRHKHFSLKTLQVDVLKYRQRIQDEHTIGYHMLILPEINDVTTRFRSLNLDTIELWSCKEQLGSRERR